MIDTISIKDYNPQVPPVAVIERILKQRGYEWKSLNIGWEEVSILEKNNKWKMFEVVKAK